MTNCRYLGVLISLRFATAALAGVDTYTTTLRWQGPEEPPFSFVGDPVPMFDSQNGSRRLGLVRIRYNEYWKATMLLDNPLGTQQCVEWREWNIGAIADPSAGEDVIVFGYGEPARHGRIGAPPFQQASQTVDWNGFAASGYDYTMRGDWFYLLDFIGPGLVTFESNEFNGGFSTFLINNPGPNCTGGFLGGGPIGFSTPLRMIESVVTYEYHWIPSSCPVDLTTLSTPGSQFYGQPDGIVDRDDFFYFLDQLALANLAVADLTTHALPALPGFGVPNGVLNNDDFFYYLLKYAEGC